MADDSIPPLSADDSADSILAAANPFATTADEHPFDTEPAEPFADLIQEEAETHETAGLEGLQGHSGLV